VTETTAIVIHEHGPPAEVVRVESRQLPEPREGEALVRMLAAPINPSDLNVIEGKYPIRPDLPGVPGGEGVGEVVTLGPGAKLPAEGTRVLVPPGTGTWCKECIVPAGGLVEIPSDVDLEQAAMLMINPPSAWRMVRRFANLRPGDWLAQNAANSGVGRSVIAICKSLGIHTVNLVRREELIPELEEAGADAVLLDNDHAPDEIKARTGEAPPRLGLNAVGGESAVRLANALAPGGTLVTYGAMSKEPLRIPNGLLIFKGIRFHGFWVARWFRNASPRERADTFEFLVDLARHGALRVKVAATYPLDHAREALAHAAREARGGKILFKM